MGGGIEVGFPSRGGPTLFFPISTAVLSPEMLACELACSFFFSAGGFFLFLHAAA